jgi:SAM-dependent methyltransferase
MPTTVVRTAALSLTAKNGQVVDISDGSPFDVDSYSRFKYGQTGVALTYGFAVARAFIGAFPALAASTKRVVVTGPSYKYLPTPAQGIADAFSTALNTHRMMKGLEPVLPMHIIRSQVGTDTYAMVSLAERAKLLGKSNHHVDGSLIHDAIVISIDDVKLTGHTEQRMHERLMPHEPDTICYLHLAVVADSPPQIEAVMNSAFKTTLDTIAADIAAGNFRLGSRVFDFILKWNDEDELYRFLCERTDAFLMELHAALVGSTSEFYNRYPNGCATLNRVVRERKLPVMSFTLPSREETDAADPMQYLSADERTTVLDYDANANKRQRGPEFWLPEVATFAGLLPTGGRILEIGCGNGAEGESLTGHGFSYVGTDISAGYLAEARRLRPGLDTRHMSAYNLLFSPNSFDGLWSGNTLYHLPKNRLGEALDQIRGVVRKGGLVFISLPMGSGEGMWTKQSFGYDSTRLWSKYTLKEALETFNQHGLQVLQIDKKESNGSGKADEVISWTLFYLTVSK